MAKKPARPETAEAPKIRTLREQKYCLGCRVVTGHFSKDERKSVCGDCGRESKFGDDNGGVPKDGGQVVPGEVQIGLLDTGSTYHRQITLPGIVQPFVMGPCWPDLAKAEHVPQMATAIGLVALKERHWCEACCADLKGIGK